MNRRTRHSGCRCRSKCWTADRPLEIAVCTPRAGRIRRTYTRASVHRREKRGAYSFAAVATSGLSTASPPILRITTLIRFTKSGDQCARPIHRGTGPAVKPGPLRRRNRAAESEAPPTPLARVRVPHRAPSRVQSSPRPPRTRLVIVRSAMFSIHTPSPEPRIDAQIAARLPSGEKRGKTSGMVSGRSGCPSPCSLTSAI